MPASAADPVSSVLKNAFASHGANRNEIGTMHQVTTGLIRGGSSSSVLLGNGSVDHEPAPYSHNGSSKVQIHTLPMSANSSPTCGSKIENGIRANAKKLLLGSQQCSVEFDEPTRHVSGMCTEQVTKNMAGASSIGKSRIIVLNPHQRHQVSKSNNLCNALAKISTRG